MNNDDTHTAGMRTGYGGVIAILAYTAVFAVMAGLELAPGQVLVLWIAKALVVVSGVVYALGYLFLVRRGVLGRTWIKVAVVVVAMLVLMPLTALYAHDALLYLLPSLAG